MCLTGIYNELFTEMYVFWWLKSGNVVVNGAQAGAAGACRTPYIYK